MDGCSMRGLLFESLFYARSYSPVDRFYRSANADDEEIRPAYLLSVVVYWNDFKTQSKLALSCRIRSRT
jgi:hypothetical protein